MDTLPSAVLTHCLYPFLRSKDVGALAQTSKKMHAARNYTTAVEDAGRIRHMLFREWLIAIAVGKVVREGGPDDNPNWVGPHSWNDYTAVACEIVYCVSPALRTQLKQQSERIRKKYIE